MDLCMKSLLVLSSGKWWHRIALRPAAASFGFETGAAAGSLA